MHTFKIHAPLDASKTSVEMDGKPLDGVTRIEFSISAGRLTEVKLVVLGYVDVTTEFKEVELIRAVGSR